MRQMVLSYALTLCLSLAMAASAVVAGVAQGQTDHPTGPLTELVICDTLGGLSTILVDGEGNRVDPERHCGTLPCQDCLSSVVSFVPLAQVYLSLTFTAQPVRRAVHAVSVRRYSAVFKPARAPPFKV